MKEKLERIRDVAREMLMWPGGREAGTWHIVWGYACQALKELEEQENDGKG